MAAIVADSDSHLAAIAGGVVLAVVASTAVGAAVDVWRARRSSTEKGKEQRRRPSLPAWAMGMCVSSYALLVPGLLAHLFTARTDFLGSMNLAKYDETMVSLVRRLARDHMMEGSVLVAFYAMAITLLKIVLLILGQSLRRRGPANVRRARTCIKVVQAISKWACPDMFAYILLMCLMRGLDKPPSLQSGMTLGLGFTCFSVFCVASTVSSLGIRLPELPAQEAKIATPRGCGCVGPRTALLIIAALTSGFLAFFTVGLAQPSMSLRMDLQLLYKVRPDLVPMAPLIEALHLGDLLHKDVSVSQCIVSRPRWRGERPPRPRPLRRLRGAAAPRGHGAPRQRGRRESLGRLRLVCDGEADVAEAPEVVDVGRFRDGVLGGCAVPLEPPREGGHRQCAARRRGLAPRRGVPLRRGDGVGLREGRREGGGGAVGCELCDLRAQRRGDGRLVLAHAQRALGQHKEHGHRVGTGVDDIGLLRRGGEVRARARPQLWAA